MKVFFFNYYMPILRYGWLYAINQVKDKAPPVLSRRVTAPVTLNLSSNYW
jgi:hypothetical protein